MKVGANDDFEHRYVQNSVIALLHLVSSCSMSETVQRVTSVCTLRK